MCAISFPNTPVAEKMEIINIGYETTRQIIIIINKNLQNFLTKWHAIILHVNY